MATGAVEVTVEVVRATAQTTPVGSLPQTGAELIVALAVALCSIVAGGLLVHLTTVRQTTHRLETTSDA